MRIETKYFADDGTEFETKKECLAYEEEQLASFDSVMFFDEKFVWHDKPTIPFIESDALYIKVLDAEKAARLFVWLYNICGAYYPENVEDGHVYSYCGDEYADENNGWVDCTKRMEDAMRIVDAIEKAVSAE